MKKHLLLTFQTYPFILLYESTNESPALRRDNDTNERV